MGNSGTSPLKIIVMVVAFIAAVMIGASVGRDAPGWVVAVGLLVVVIMVFYFLSGNKKEVRLDQAAASDALAMQAPADKARIYIARHGFVASQQGMNIAIDDTHQGQFKSGRVLVADLQPGRHHVTAQLARGGKGSAGSLDLDLAAGTVTVVKTGVSMGGMNGKCTLEVMPDMATGRGHVAGNKFVAWQQG
jgi:predicted heme/steroid binding protein